MKVRFNTTIDQQLLEQVKVHAVKKQVSVSQLIESYFKSIVHKRPVKKKNLLDLVESLQPQKEIIKQSRNKKLFYEEHGKKYGF